eukprot:scaffold78311_cov33-Tisochrysis_lutea.AAC.1
MVVVAQASTKYQMHVARGGQVAATARVRESTQETMNHVSLRLATPRSYYWCPCPLAPPPPDTTHGVGNHPPCAANWHTGAGGPHHTCPDPPSFSCQSVTVMSDGTSDCDSSQPDPIITGPLASGAVDLISGTR